MLLLHTVQRGVHRILLEDKIGNGRGRCKAAWNHSRLHGSRHHIRFSCLFLAVLTDVSGVPLLSHPELSRLHLETAVDLRPNLHQCVTVDAASPLAFRKRILYHIYGSPFGNHIVNAAATSTSYNLPLGLSVTT